MKKISLLLFVATCLSSSIFAQWDNSALNGPWILLTFEADTTDVQPVAVIFDGNGTITELVQGPKAIPSGNYNVMSNGIFTGSILIEGFGIPIFGQVMSTDAAKLMVVFGSDTVGPMNLIRVVDQGALEGAWTGTVTTGQTNQPIGITINSGGSITGGTGLTSPIDGWLFFQSSYVAGVVRTGSNDEWANINFEGSMSTDSIWGNVDFDCDSCQGGVFNLVRELNTGISSQPQFVSGVWHYPNPFNQTFTLEYTLVKDMQVTVLIYDQTGKQVRTLISEKQSKGVQTITWNSIDDNGVPVPKGIYSYIMVAEGVIFATDMMLKM